MDFFSTRLSKRWNIQILFKKFSFGHIEGVYVTIGGVLYSTGAHFRGKLQHVGDVSEWKIKCGPIRTREIGGVRLQDELYASTSSRPKCSKKMQQIYRRTPISKCDFNKDAKATSLKSHFDVGALL